MSRRRRRRRIRRPNLTHTYNTFILKKGFLVEARCPIGILFDCTRKDDFGDIWPGCNSPRLVHEIRSRIEDDVILVLREEKCSRLARALWEWISCRARPALPLKLRARRAPHTTVSATCIAATTSSDNLRRRSLNYQQRTHTHTRTHKRTHTYAKCGPRAYTVRGRSSVVVYLPRSSSSSSARGTIAGRPTCRVRHQQLQSSRVIAARAYHTAAIRSQGPSESVTIECFPATGGEDIVNRRFRNRLKKISYNSRAYFVFSFYYSVICVCFFFVRPPPPRKYEIRQFARWKSDGGTGIVVAATAMYLPAPAAAPPPAWCSRAVPSLD